MNENGPGVGVIVGVFVGGSVFVGIGVFVGDGMGVAVSVGRAVAVFVGTDVLVGAMVGGSAIRVCALCVAADCAAFGPHALRNNVLRINRMMHDWTRFTALPPRSSY